MEPSQEPPVHLIPEKKPFLTMPLAIVIAGALIAWSILLVGWQGSKAPNTAAVADSGIYPLTPEPDKKTLNEIANKIGVNKTAFATCVAEKPGTNHVAADIASAMQLGITGTPTSYIVSKDGQKIVIEGAQPAALVRATIEGLLAGTKNKDADTRVKIPPITVEDHVLGDPDIAEIIIYEYSDFECPFCQRFQPTMNEIMESYGNKVAWVYRHFPLEQIHPTARIRAEMSECAARLGGNDAFWKFTNLMLGTSK